MRELCILGPPSPVYASLLGREQRRAPSDPGSQLCPPDGYELCPPTVICKRGGRAFLLVHETARWGLFRRPPPAAGPTSSSTPRAGARLRRGTGSREEEFARSLVARKKARGDARPDVVQSACSRPILSPPRPVPSPPPRVDRRLRSDSGLGGSTASRPLRAVVSRRHPGASTSPVGDVAHAMPPRAGQGADQAARGGARLMPDAASFTPPPKRWQRLLRGGRRTARIGSG